MLSEVYISKKRTSTNLNTNNKDMINNKLMLWEL
jgi:hypothetical protein